MHTIGSMHNAHKHTHNPHTYTYIFGNEIIIRPYEPTAVNSQTDKLLFNPVVLDSSENLMKIKSTKLFCIG